MDARELLEQKDFVPPEVKDIEITDAAINRLLQVGYKQVEFSVEGGGCSGMNYKMIKFDRELNERDKVIKEGELELIIPFSSFVYFDRKPTGPDLHGFFEPTFYTGSKFLLL